MSPPLVPGDSIAGMRTKHVMSRAVVPLVGVLAVFGLATLMILERFDPTVITTVVTGTSLAATELVRQLRLSAPASPEQTRTPQDRS